jgi:hypothetical protein
MLSKNHLNDICLLRHKDSKTCRYLRQDEKIWDKWYCLKCRDREKSSIDSKVNDWVSDCKQKGKNPEQFGIPLGDNCAGYPLLKNIKQGYDV